MADKKLNEVTKVTDMAYVPVILSDGSVGQIAKADLATVVAGNIGDILFPTKTYHLAVGEEVDTGFNNYGLYIIRSTSNGITAILLIGTNPSATVMIGGESSFAIDFATTSSRIIVNRKSSNGSICVKNNTSIERQFQIRRFRIL